MEKHIPDIDIMATETDSKRSRADEEKDLKSKRLKSPIDVSDEDHLCDQTKRGEQEEADDIEVVGPRKPVPLYPLLNYPSTSKVDGVVTFPNSDPVHSRGSTPVGFPLPQYGTPLSGYSGLTGSAPPGLCLPNPVDSMDSLLNSTAFYSGKGQPSQSDHADFIPHFVFTPRHPMGKKYFRCPQCRYYTDRKNNLKRHIGTMHQDCGKVLECCEIMFRSKAALRDHIMLFHRTGYRCKHCGRNFCRKALLKRHLAVHGGQKEYYCDTCDYATSQRASFDRHTRNHALKTPFSSEEDEALESKLGILQASQHDQFNFWYLASSGCLPESIFPYQRAGALFNNHGLPMPDRLRLTHQDGEDSIIPPVTCELNLAGTSAADNNRTSTTDVKSELETDKEQSTENADSDKGDESCIPFREMALFKGNMSLFNKRLFDRPYKCNDCASTFSNQQRFRDHVKQCKRPDIAEPQAPLRSLLKPGTDNDDKDTDKPLCLVKGETKNEIKTKEDRNESTESCSCRSTSPENLHLEDDKSRSINLMEKKNYFLGNPFRTEPAMYKPLDLSQVFRPDPFFPFPPFGWLGGGSPLTPPDVLPWPIGTRGLGRPEASQGAAPLSPRDSPVPRRGSPVGGHDTDGSQGASGETSSLPFKKRLLHS